MFLAVLCMPVVLISSARTRLPISQLIYKIGSLVIIIYIQCLHRPLTLKIGRYWFPELIEACCDEVMFICGQYFWMCPVCPQP